MSTHRSLALTRHRRPRRPHAPRAPDRRRLLTTNLTRAHPDQSAAAATAYQTGTFAHVVRRLLVDGFAGTNRRPARRARRSCSQSRRVRGSGGATGWLRGPGCGEVVTQNRVIPAMYGSCPSRCPLPHRPPIAPPRRSPPTTTSPPTRAGLTPAVPALPTARPDGTQWHWMHHL
jgi:hypothetical protein